MKVSRPIALVVVALVVLVPSCGSGETTDTPVTTSTPPSGTTNTSPPLASSDPAPSSVTPGEPTTLEIQFRADGFELVGDLILPASAGPHPAVIVVSGSGSQTRDSTPGYSVVKRTFGAAGFAVFSWDKPGNGASTGELDGEHTVTERADILLEGIRVLGERADIDATRIGLWGLSQAGWVMPLALERNPEIAFMVVVSGGGEDSIDQMAFQISEQLVCDGLSTADAELVETYGAQAAKGTTYELYTEAMAILLEIPGTEQFVGTSAAAEDEWQPWPPDIDAYLDPMDVIEHTTIPVLAVFGEMDKNVDPVQGAAAYEAALLAAGNQNYLVEAIPGVGHTMQRQATGCLGEPGGAVSQRFVELMEQWADMLAATL
jgi:pimeloyl-ACP methyl ester carboxylesterase